MPILQAAFDPSHFNCASLPIKTKTITPCLDQIKITQNFEIPKYQGISLKSLQMQPEEPNHSSQQKQLKITSQLRPVLRNAG
jgi:hypothetical protein